MMLNQSFRLKQGFSPNNPRQRPTPVNNPSHTRPPHNHPSRTPPLYTGKRSVNDGRVTTEDKTGQHTTRAPILNLADGSTIVGPVACASMTVPDLSPESTSAFDLFIMSVKDDRIFQKLRRENENKNWSCSTYHTGAVAAAEMPVSIRILARAVGASLVTTIAGPAHVSGLDFGECRSGHDGGGGHESGEKDGDLHCERGGMDFVGLKEDGCLN